LKNKNISANAKEEKTIIFIYVISSMEKISKYIFIIYVRMYTLHVHIVLNENLKIK